ncbi:MAG: hypothetical protein FWE77_01715 [Clostridia bacterium]|nr:hypothetical protein [Clostridia bacterium]
MPQPVPPITQDDVFFLLEPLVGLPLLLAHSELSSDIAAMLSQYDWRGEDPPEALCARIEGKLFNSIYSYTNGNMTVRDAHGRNKKVYTDALAQMAEALMGPVFDRFPDSQEAFEALNSYALRRLSLPALKRLYTGYMERMEPMNRALFARVIAENFPSGAYEDWLAK